MKQTKRKPVPKSKPVHASACTGPEPVNQEKVDQAYMDVLYILRGGYEVFSFDDHLDRLGKTGSRPWWRAREKAKKKLKEAIREILETWNQEMF